MDPKIVIEAVNRLISQLDSQGFSPRLVVSADYLTTLYQLLHLRSKYEGVEFMKISKIDLIMQGNPYNTSEEHYQKLKKKLLLIQPWYLIIINVIKPNNGSITPRILLKQNPTIINRKYLASRSTSGPSTQRLQTQIWTFTRKSCIGKSTQRKSEGLTRRK